MKFGIVACIVFFLQSIGYTQIPTFRAEVDALEIHQDQYLQVEFILSNAQGKSFIPPDFKGWTILNGPNTSTQVSIVNGVRNSSISFGYTLTPNSLGEITIGKASIQVNNKTMNTEPLKIMVIKSGAKAYQGKNAKEISKKDIFIQAKATPEKAFVGQQILLEYKLFTSLDVENYNITHAPEFKGFHVNNIPRLSYDNQEFINGKRYVTKVIYAASIYPIQNGDFDIEALHARASVITDANGDANTFFLLPSTEGINLKSEPLTIKVSSLPSPSPVNFSGAVGKFKMASQSDQLTAKVNDAISITVYVEGDGDLNRVGKPFLNIDSSAFQLYEPKITKENQDFRTSGFIGMRELIYPVVATLPGTHKIIPSFIYFDADSQKYVTLAAEVYNITVSGSSAVVQKDKSISRDTASEMPIIQHPRLGESTFVGTIWFYILMGLPFIAWLAVSWYRYRIALKQELFRSDLIHQEKKSSTLHQLDALRASIPTSNSKTIIDQIDQMLTEYLRIKWNLTDHGMTKKQWIEYLKTTNLDTAAQDKIVAVLNETERAVYGGQLPEAKLEEIITTAKEIVESVSTSG